MNRRRTSVNHTHFITTESQTHSKGHLHLLNLYPLNTFASTCCTNYTYSATFSNSSTAALFVSSNSFHNYIPQPQNQLKFLTAREVPNASNQNIFRYFPQPANPMKLPQIQRLVMFDNTPLTAPPIQIQQKSTRFVLPLSPQKNSLMT